jgi:hypothetical protein
VRVGFGGEEVSVGSLRSTGRVLLVALAAEDLERRTGFEAACACVLLRPRTLETLDREERLERGR